MPSQFQLPVAITIAGSDTGGGAGVQADLKTFAAFGVHGVCAITCLTAQNPRRVLAIEPCSPAMLRAQLKAVSEDFPIRAAKTGMLGNRRLVAEVVRWCRKVPRVAVVVDPVLVSTSGRRLLDRDGEKLLRDQLLPIATLVTPNLAEAVRLSGRRIRALDDVREAARIIHARFGCAVLVKGGHLTRESDATDFFLWDKFAWDISRPRWRGVKTHGTGCTFSAAIAAGLASGQSLPAAVNRAKDFISEAIAHSPRAGRHALLQWNREGIRVKFAE